MEPYAEEVCSICLEIVLVPVEPMTFLCKNQFDVSCFSVKRVCLLCLERYLGLDCHRNCRPMKKCLFCPKSASPANPKSDCFRVDYGLMNRDDQTRSCPLCGFTSTHIGIARHLLKECEHYSIECECGHTCPRNEFDRHKVLCPHYSSCEFCSTFVLESGLPKHMFYQHDKTRCFTCHRYVDMNQLNDHLLIHCPDRSLSCEFCNCSVKKKTMPSHLKKHLTDIQKNIKNMQNLISKEKKIYEKINAKIAEGKETSSLSEPDKTR